MKYRLGLFGASKFLQYTYLNEIIRSDLFDIQGLATLTQKGNIFHSALYSTRLYQSYDELIDGDLIDVAYISVSNEMHYTLAQKLVNKGIHCIIEKPMVGSLEEYTNLKQLAYSNNVVIFENFCFLYHKQYAFLKQVIESRTHGDVREISIRFGFPEFADQDNFRYRKDKQGGAFRDAGIYIYRLASQFLEYKSTCSTMTTHKVSPYEVDMSGACLIFDDKISVLGGWGFSNFYRCEVDVWFKSARLVFPRFFTAKPDFAAKAKLYAECNNELTFVDNQYLNSINYFCSLIHDQIERSLYMKEISNYYNIIETCSQRK